MTKTEVKAEVEPQTYICPKCDKVYKRESALVKHVATCEGRKTEDKRDKPKRVPMTAEQKKAQRKVYVDRWLAKNTTIQVRFGNNSEELRLIDETVADWQKDDPKLGRASVIKEAIKQYFELESEEEEGEDEAAEDEAEE